MRYPHEYYLLRALGLDPDETVAESTLIKPLGNGQYEVTWDGIRMVSADELTAAIQGADEDWKAARADG